MENNYLFLSKAAESVLKIDKENEGTFSTVNEKTISLFFLPEDLLNAYTGAVLSEKVGVTRDDLKSRKIDYPDGDVRFETWFIYENVKYFTLQRDEKEAKELNSKIGFIIE